MWPSRKYNILRYGTKLDLFLNVSVKYLYEILSQNFENLSEIDWFWQLFSFVYTDKLLRPWQKIRRHLWPSRKYNILRYGTKLDLFLNVSVKNIWKIFLQLIGAICQMQPLTLEEMFRNPSTYTIKLK